MLKQHQMEKERKKTFGIIEQQLYLRGNYERQVDE